MNAPDDLERLAIELDATTEQAAGPGEAGTDPAAPPLRNAQILLMAGQMVRETLCTMAKVQSPRQTLPDAAIEPLADAWGAVLDKHGYQLSAMVGDYALELRAIAITVPAIMACRAALAEELKANQEKATDQDKASSSSPEPAEVVNG